MAKGILARLIDLKVMVGMLDDRDFELVTRQDRDELFNERGLPTP
jgi:hypothetical protein